MTTGSPHPAQAPHPAEAPRPAEARHPEGRSGARGRWRRVPTAALAAGTLVLAFAIAQGTGVRALGGAVLVLGVVWCAWRALPAVGALRVGAVVALGAACFVASHVLAGALGAWPSVLLVAAVLAAGTWALVDRPRGSGPRPGRSRP